MQPVEPPWLTIAEKEIGVSEKNPGDNSRILEYHASTNLRAQNDETSWCSSFVNFCIEKAGINGTSSAMSRSWLQWGVKLTLPAFGCVTILSRGSNPLFGHVGFYVGSKDLKTIQILGGNQNDSVCIQNFPRHRVLGYRWI